MRLANPMPAAALLLAVPALAVQPNPEFPMERAFFAMQLVVAGNTVGQTPAPPTAEYVLSARYEAAGKLELTGNAIKAGRCASVNDGVETQAELFVVFHTNGHWYAITQGRRNPDGSFRKPGNIDEPEDFEQHLPGMQAQIAAIAKAGQLEQFRLREEGDELVATPANGARYAYKSAQGQVVLRITRPTGIVEFCEFGRTLVTGPSPTR